MKFISLIGAAVMTTVWLQAAFKLVTFFKQLGVDYVFDVTFSRDLALMER